MARRKEFSRAKVGGHLRSMELRQMNEVQKTDIFNWLGLSSLERRHTKSLVGEEVRCIETM